MPATRILVTGSRDWPTYPSVSLALFTALGQAGGPVIVVHGDCPTGADNMAKRWAHEHRADGVAEEAHPADWGTCDKNCFHAPRPPGHPRGCPAAGPRRNALMVSLGAAVCLAFPLGDSRGTRNAMRRAREAGIPVVDCSLSIGEWGAEIAGALAPRR